MTNLFIKQPNISSIYWRPFVRVLYSFNSYETGIYIYVRYPYPEFNMGSVDVSQENMLTHNKAIQPPEISCQQVQKLTPEAPLSTR